MPISSQHDCVLLQNDHNRLTEWCYALNNEEKPSNFLRVILLCYTTTVEPPKRGHYGDEHIVHSREVVLFRSFLFSRMRSEGCCSCQRVCVGVCFTYGASVRPENAITCSAGNEGQNTSGELPKTTEFKSYAAKQERKSQLPVIPTSPSQDPSVPYT